MGIEPVADRFASFGWGVREVDGHDVEALLQAFDTLPGSGELRPTCIIARTRKGKGVEMMEQAPQTWHIGLLSPDQKAQVVAEISRRMR
jgi:transketolase